MTKRGQTNWKRGGMLLTSSVAITILFFIKLTTSLKPHVDYRGVNLKFVVFHVRRNYPPPSISI